MPKNSHLTLQDRSIICTRISQGVPFSQIALELEKSPDTISREVRAHRVSIETGSYGRGFNPCIHRNHCNKTFICGTCIHGDGSVGPDRTALSIAATSRKKNAKNFLIRHMSVMGAKTVRNAP